MCGAGGFFCVSPHIFRGSTEVAWRRERGASDLVSEPVRALDRVVKVPPPVVLRHVAKSRIDATLRGDSVGPGGEELCDASNLEALLSEANSSAETGTAGADDNGVILQAEAC